MAKFKDFKYTLNGFEKKGRINVCKLGLFSISMQLQDVEEMGIQDLTEKKFETVNDLEKDLNKSLNDYYNSTEKAELLIQIKYGTSGNFNSNDNFKMKDWVGSEIESKIKFDFRLVIKRERNGHTVYLKDVVQISKQDNNFKERILSMGNTWTIIGDYCSRTVLHDYGQPLTIPYSDEAFNTLYRSSEGLKNIANILEAVFSQEQNLLSNQLNGNNLFKISNE